MDADIAMVPSNILQVMLKQDKPILAANCMFWVLQFLILMI